MDTPLSYIMWIITNLTIKNDFNLHKKIADTYTLYSSIHLKEHDKFSFDACLLDGYIIDRKSQEIFHSTPDTLLNSPRLQSNITDVKEFPGNIKGNFIFFDLKTERFDIYSDHFGIKKFFYYLNGVDFIISDSLKAITENIRVSPSTTSMALYALMYHFVAGATAFEKVFHNKPAQHIRFANNKLVVDQYWRPDFLLTTQPVRTRLRDIAERLISVLETSLKYIDKSRISLSLTGGADTRNLLAIMLHLGIRPHLYTYGNPQSVDCVKAAAIARGLGLEHEIHDIHMDTQTFEKYAKKIIKSEGGLTSIHRVHRIMAVEREKQYADCRFLGTLGGEFVKGVSEEDYITPAVVFENWKKHDFSTEILHQYACRKGMLAESLDIAYLRKTLLTEPYFSGSIVSRKFNALAHITAHLHDAQDVNLYNKVMNPVLMPFLDIDYLETLFASQYPFVIKEEIKNPFLKRIENPVYASRFLQCVCPLLLRFEYSGNHKPSEVLFNKYYAAFTKAVRTRFRRPAPANFPLGTWMKDFVIKHLLLCNDYPVIRDIFDIRTMLEEVRNQSFRPVEPFWLKYTNPIMMRYILDEYN